MMEMFDLKSIEANKRGEKSETQIKEIKEAVNPNVWLYGGLGILVFGGCFTTMVSSMDAGGAISAFGWILAIVGIVAALRGFTTWNLRRKLLAEPVQFAEGTIGFKMQEGLGQLVDVDRYVAETIEGKKLNPIGLAGTSQSLPPGDYRFYYLNTRNWLLGSEPLSSEEEMRNNLNDVLAKVFGYDKSQLENFRKQAREGKLKTAEGLPKIDTYDHAAINEDDVASQEIYLTLGDFKVQISSRACAAIFTNIPHRIYYGAEGNGAMAAIEAV
jgi:hypothetical protein